MGRFIRLLLLRVRARDGEYRSSLPILSQLPCRDRMSHLRPGADRCLGALIRCDLLAPPQTVNLHCLREPL